MSDYEKMSNDELRAALKVEAFSDDEIDEILKHCPTRTNQCINKQKTKIKRRKEIEEFNIKPKKLNPDRGF